MPALPALTAKILVLVEKVLDVFVTVEVEEIAECGILVFNGTTTTCGDELVTALALLFYQVANLGGYMLSALGVKVV